MLDEYSKQKKEIGERFKLFRQLICKSTKVLSTEAGIIEDRIILLEKGAFIPDILFIEFFTREYGLNLTWLVNNTGKLFFKKGPKTQSAVFNICKENDMNSSLIREIISLNIKRLEQPYSLKNEYKKIPDELAFEGRKLGM